MADELILRVCNTCGIEDTEPHHVQYVAFNHPVTGSGVDLSVTKHIHCCADEGCEICTTDMRFASEAGADTKHMRKFLQNRSKEEYQELFEKYGIESPDFQIPRTAEEE